MAILNSYVSHYQRVSNIGYHDFHDLSEWQIADFPLSFIKWSAKFFLFVPKAEVAFREKKNIISGKHQQWEISMISTIHQPFDSFHGYYASINLHHPLRLWTVRAFVLPGRGFLYRYWVYLWFIGISWGWMDLGFIGIWDFASSQLIILTKKNTLW